MKSETLGPAGKSEQRTEEKKEQRGRVEEVTGRRYTVETDYMDRKLGDCLGKINMCLTVSSVYICD